MAVDKKKKRLPILSAALICEKALMEVDHVPSIIRVVDKVVIVPDEIPKKNQKGSKEFKSALNLTVFVSLKSGDYEGDCDIALDKEYPSGKITAGKVVKATFLGKEKGVNIRFHPITEIDDEGLHWFHLKANKQTLTRIPLLVEFAKPTKPENEPR